MAKPNHSPTPAKPQTRRAGLPPPRTPRPRTRTGVTPPALPKAGSELQDRCIQDGHLYEAQRRWFEREVNTLRRLAQTERLAGDYVAAQRFERELDSFIREASALLGPESEMGSI